VKRLAALLVSVLGFAFTGNGYRPLTKHPHGSLSAFGYGVFASEPRASVFAGRTYAQ
jgi:hypothetical protein